jgi:pimeloyl-ACP methyl ester carboxylesterase
MASFPSGALALAYDDIPPHAPPVGAVLLVHGFASNRAENWRRLGWYSAFERAGYRLIALDLRGHGESDKPYDPAAYGRAQMAGDVIALIDHLGLRRVTLMGYSLGAHLALAAALAAPHRLDHLILGGIGGRMLSSDPAPAPAMTLAQAFLCANPDDITEPVQKGFRLFAQAQGEDRLALAACAQGLGAPADRGALANLHVPTLVVAGARDDLAGDPEILADAIPDATAVTLPACDHFSAIPHALFKAAVFDFLEGPEDDVPAFE